MPLPSRFLSLLLAFVLLQILCRPSPGASPEQVTKASQSSSPATPESTAYLPLVQRGDLPTAPIYMANYAYPQDFAELAKRGINTILTDLSSDGSDWSATYQAAIAHKLKLIPLIWGDNQTIWAWNDRAKEWELNAEKYPSSVGAQFLKFLKENPKFLAQTFAIYSFHEPLWEPDKTGCDRLKKFYQQITEQEFPDGSLLVYGEDITMGWPDSGACLSGVVDYESHHIYPFAQIGDFRYRAFNHQNNYYDPPTNDLESVIQAELAYIDARLARYAASPPAATGRRPKPILLIQTFAAIVEEPGLWNRMPEAWEMETLASRIVLERKDKIVGLAWYPFQNPSSNYTHWLARDRYDTTGADRWEVITKVGGLLLGK